jgi:hypothetical protein
MNDRQKYKKELMDSSIAIVDHNDDVHSVLLKEVNSVFNQSDYTYNQYRLEAYRTLMLKAQEKLTDIEAQRLISKAVCESLEQYLGTSSWLIQSNLYLRAARPINDNGSENIGWHREPFYGPELEKSVNIWTPIRGVTEQNSLQYIPCSQNIPCEVIKTANIGSDFTQRFSTGHKLGFNYDQKWITSGVDLSSAKRLMVVTKKSAVFSGMLIHGAATNRSEKLRFSVDFQVIRKSDYRSRGKKFHFSSGKPYFVEI